MNFSKIIWISIFGIAMAFLESAVVIYLRALYYPGGFSFPLQPIAGEIALTEFLREIATLIMLAGIGWMAGKSFPDKFAWFLFTFAVWDIFYYVFLKLLINWPLTILDWDILFLIPVTWVGPVLAPVIISCTMILFALTIVSYSEKNKHLNISLKEWILLITGSFILILSFTLDYMRFILAHYNFSELWSLRKTELFDLSFKFIPEKFNWGIFIMGEVIIAGTIFLFVKRNKRNP